MKESIVTRYFLGANSRYGFYSLYDKFIEPADGDFLWVIKGGPGCGKSSFMKKLGAAAEQAGLSVEYIHCSGDPESLDAVWFPALRQGYVDGTAPHVIEAVYPAAASMYLDLGAYYDHSALTKALPDVIELNHSYKLCYRRAYDFLSAAAKTSPLELSELYGPTEKEKIRKKTLSIASREFQKFEGTGRKKERFLSAISCSGRVFCRETVETLCSRVYTLDNEFGLAEPFLSQLQQLAAENRQHMILCPDPLDPHKTEALLFPELSLAFVAVDHRNEYQGTVHRHVRLDTLVNRSAAAKIRPAFRSARKLSHQAQENGLDALRQAKELHDQLEAIYNPHVDFNSIYVLAQHHIDRLLSAAEQVKNLP